VEKLLARILILSLIIITIVETQAMPDGRQATPAAKNIADATENFKAAPLDQKEAALQNLVTTLRENEDLQALLTLEAKQAQLAAELVNAKADKRTKNTNWFFSSNEYKATRDRVAHLKKELRDVNKQIAHSQSFKEVSKSDRSILHYAMVMIVTIAGIVAMETYFGVPIGYIEKNTGWD
jgi:hypothetical protein